MSENVKKPRVMSTRGFISKSLSAKVSAETFLKTHRTWMETGEIAVITSPILTRLDSGELLPTPALDQIRTAVYHHMLALDMKENEDRMVRLAVDSALKAKKDKPAGEPKAPKQPKAYIATVYDQSGDIASRINAQGKEELLQKEFDKSQDGDRWIDRRLVTGETGWYGEVSHTKMLTRNGEPITLRIDRKDSFARTFQVKSGPAMRVSKAAGKLSFGVRVRNHVSKFSYG